MDLKAILQLVQTYVDNLMVSLNIKDILFPIVLSVLGISTIVLARRVTRIVKKRNFIDNDDKFMVTTKGIGLLLIFVALLMIMFQTING